MITYQERGGFGRCRGVSQVKKGCCMEALKRDGDKSIKVRNVIRHEIRYWMGTLTGRTWANPCSPLIMPLCMRSGAPVSTAVHERPLSRVSFRHSWRIQDRDEGRRVKAGGGVNGMAYVHAATMEIKHDVPHLRLLLQAPAASHHGLVAPMFPNRLGLHGNIL